MLEVRGFSSEKKVLEDLHKWLPGEPRIALELSDNITLTDKLKKRTLQASGVAYLVGDWGFWTYNKEEADKLGMAGAFSYFLGTLALVFYGRNDQSDLQVMDKAKELKQFLIKENITPSEGSALHHVVKEKPKSVFQSLHEFGKRYPSELFNSVTALAGVFVAASAHGKATSKLKPGMDKRALKEFHDEGWMDVGLGVTTAASGVLATVVKEKSPDPDEPPAKGAKWIWQKVQEHPLAIAGVGYTISTLFHAASTWKAYKEAKRTGDKKRLGSVPRRALFVGMALLSEFLLAISSKGHGQGVTSDQSVNNSVIALAANMVTISPPEKQEQLINDLAGFLSKPEVLALKDTQVAEQLRSQVKAMQENPWVVCDHPEMADTTDSKVLASAKTPATWQSKVSQPSGPQQPQISS